MKSLCLFICLLFALPTHAQPTRGYYRFPTINGERIIFTAEGDLWQTGAAGGMAQRLTTHQGVESRASISPDGTTIAFSAQYEGPTEVFTMPMEGGLPTRLTYESGNALVVGWSPDGRIIYATRHFSNLPNTQLVLLNPKNGETTLTPLAQASDGCYDPSGRTLYFTRLPFQGSHTKRYKGGTAQNIWKYTQGDAEAIPLTGGYDGTSKAPMWWDGRIYFASDRDGIMNLWSMNPDGGDLKQHTSQKDWDVRSPSMNKGRIVYQLGADLHLFEIAKNEDRAVRITLASDFDQMREKWITNPFDYLTSAHVSPNGDRVVLAARGRVFAVPAQKGRLTEVTRRNGVRHRDARFLPDGKSLLMLSDETGEFEYWKSPSNGVGQPTQLTKDGRVFRYEGIPSPDGKCFAYTDKDQQLWIYDFEKGTSKHVTRSEDDQLTDLRWSPDSKWLAYVQDAGNTYHEIMLNHIDDNTITAVTDDRVDSYSPAWSPDGKWLYFLSDRSFRSLVPSPWGPRQPEPFFDKTTKIYLISLLKDGRSPFEPANELVSADTADKSKEKKDSNSKKDESKKVVVVKIDLAGIQSRVSEVPVPAANYGKLSIGEKYVYVMDTETSLEPKNKLLSLEIKNTDVKTQTYMDDISDYEPSQDGKKLMVQKKSAIYVLDGGGEAPKELDKSQVDLKNWTFSIVPHEEWKQMFIDAWRMERDYFYDRNMHGADWKGLLAKHIPLVDRVADRDELDDLISQLVGELSALHIFVVGGDPRRGKDQVSIGSLGAALSKDEQHGGYRIDHIFQSDPDYPERSSPLARPGLNVHNGDLIEMINGVAVLTVANPGVLLKNQIDQQVLLKITPGNGGKSFDIVVKPIAPGAENALRYDEWEYTRRLRVEQLGRNELGYVHLRAMGNDNYSEWVRNFYPVYNRKGLIIDVRHNNGGNIDSWILEKLLRKAWFYWKARLGKPFANMQYAFQGHIVALCDENTASDGEAFTEGFRRLGLGKVIGMRTWGGEIWLSFDNPLVDKGIASAAEIGVYGPERQWLIEGHGVDPDIVVDNMPHATFGGGDAQLDAAIRYLQEELQRSPVKVPEPPPYPVKTLKQKQ